MFIGNVGQAPQIRQFENGSVANLSLAVTEKYTDRSGQQVERTEWISLVANGKLVDVIAQYVTSGTLLYVETKMRTRKYAAQDGQERSVTEFIILSMQILSRPQQAATAPQQGYQQPAYQPQTTDPHSSGYQPRGIVQQYRQQQAMQQQPAMQQQAPQYNDSLAPQDDDLPF